jgi:hypothetical protein
MKLFDKLSTPVLTLAAGASVLLMGLDLIILDPLPFIDEVFLLFMTAGSTSELMARFRGARSLPGDGGRPRLSRRDQRSAQEALSSLSARTTALIARARLLESQGHSGRLFESLQLLPDRIAQMLRSSRENEAFEARSENDPWQIRRRIAKLDKTISRLQIGRPTPKLERMRAELIELQQHEITTRSRLEASDELRDRLLALSQQVDSLAEDLANLADDGIVQGGWKTLALPDLDPAIADVLAALEHLALAEEEIDGALAAKTQGVAGTAARVAPGTRGSS